MFFIASATAAAVVIDAAIVISVDAAVTFADAQAPLPEFETKAANDARSRRRRGDGIGAHFNDDDYDEYDA